MTEPRESAAAKTARERLEHTRRELLRHMRQDRQAPGSQAGHDDPPPPFMAGDEGFPPPPHSAPHDEEGGLGGAWQQVRETVGAWWHSHPAHLALEVAEPVFDKYARAHPVRVLALSAAAGAAVVLARPWRLISVTGLLLAAVKSTQATALASAMLRPRASEPFRRHQAEQARQAQRSDWQAAQAQARAQDSRH